MNYRVIFLGTPKIAARCLQALLDSNNIEVIAVVTKPDKPVGRKQDIVHNPVKLLATKHKIQIMQPTKMNEIYDQLVSLKPDLILSCAYGQLIPESILKIPRFHCVNVHTSLLPRWRGGAPIHWAVMNNDIESGVTMMYMAKELDAGDVIYQNKIKIDRFETYRTLYDKLEGLSYKMIIDKVHTLFNDNIAHTRQDETKVTIAKNISRDDERIVWNADAITIEAKIRGLYDQPVAYCVYENLNVKVLEAHAIDEANNERVANGSIIKISKDGIFINTSNGILKIVKLQLPSKKPILVKDMLNGNHPFKVNSIFN